MSASTRNEIAALERVTGSDVSAVRRTLHESWRTFWQSKVLRAFEGRLTTPTSPKIWEYRFKNQWNHHALKGGQEGGTVGC